MNHIALGLTRQLTNASVPQDRMICIDMVKLYCSPCSLKKKKKPVAFSIEVNPILI